MWRSERRKWKRVNWSRQGGMEIDGRSETKSRTEWEALESESCERKRTILSLMVC